jgi:hypothetical protein
MRRPTRARIAMAHGRRWMKIQTDMARTAIAAMIFSNNLSMF